MDEQTIRAIIRQVLTKELGSGGPKAVANGGTSAVTTAAAAPSGAGESACACSAPVGGSIPLEVSARHVHLTTAAVEALFGPGAKLAKKRELSQPGEFLSEQRVKLVTAKGVIENVAVLGPERSAVQVELSATDCRGLGLQAPVNLSGNLTNAADVMIVGERGCINAPGSVIVAKSHVHMTPADAKVFGVADGQRVQVRIQSARPVTLDDVMIRVRENFALACHIDFDEANAAMAQCKTPACILGADNACSSAGAGVTQSAQAACAPEAPCVLFDGKLVTEEMARVVRAQGGTVQIKQGVIVTPAARDVFSNAHMKIEIV